MACSRKLGGKCIAGKLINKNKWIRPVNNTEPLKDYQIRYSNGHLPKILDIIKIPIGKGCANKFQPKNYLIKDGVWEKIGEYKNTELDRLCDDYPTIFVNKDSTSLGLYDRIPANYFENFNNNYSLMFIKIKILKLIRINTNYQGYFKKRVRANFEYKGIKYNIPITDEGIEEEYCKLDEGEYILKNDWSYLCLSMGRPFNEDNNCYKFVASITKM